MSEHYAIKDPHGIILTGTIRKTYNACVHEYCSGDVVFWDRCNHNGFSCVRIWIQELEEEAKRG